MFYVQSQTSLRSVYLETEGILWQRSNGFYSNPSLSSDGESLFTLVNNTHLQVINTQTGNLTSNYDIDIEGSFPNITVSNSTVCFLLL